MRLNTYPNPCAQQTSSRPQKPHPHLSLFAKAGAWTFGLIIGKASERQPNGQGRDVRGFGVRSGRGIANQEGAGAEPRRSLDHALLVSLESAMYGFSLDQQEFAGGASAVYQGRKRARALLTALDTAVVVEDLRLPPGNRLEALKGDRAGQHAVRINRQWHICLVWTPNGPADVEISDYH